MAKKKNIDNSDETKEAMQSWENSVKIPLADLVTPDQSRAVSSSVVGAGPYIQRIVADTAQNLQDADSIYMLNPDLHIATETIVSNILSPTDLQRGDISIGVDSRVPAEIGELIREHFSSDDGFNLNKKLPYFIKEALVKTGSVVHIPIPPSVISNIIKTNTYGIEHIGTVVDFIRPEDLKLPLIGLLGNKRINNRLDPIPSLALESVVDSFYNETTIASDVKNHEGLRPRIENAIGKFRNELMSLKEVAEHKDLIEITDNINYLAHSEFCRSAIKRNTDSIINQSWGLEGLGLDENFSVPSLEKDKEKDKASEKIIKDSAYKNRLVKMSQYMELVFNDDMKDDKDPVVIEWPSESVIPVINPFTKEHIWYYFVMDLDGNPLRLSDYLNRFRQLAERLDSSMRDQTTGTTYSFGVSYPNSNTSMMSERTTSAMLFAAYKEYFEKDIKDAIKNGTGAIEVEVPDVEDIYRMMFSRQMSKQKTRILGVPADRVSYFAYNFDARGIGESLIQKTKLISSFRAVLTVSQIMAIMNSSVNRSTLTINLDDKEIDAYETINTVLNETVSLQANNYPFGKMQPADIVDSILKAGIQTKIVGGGFPTTSVDLVESKRDVTPPSLDFQDFLQELQYSGWGLSKELIDKARSIEFMGQYENINLLQSKRMMENQKITCERSSYLIRTYLRCGGRLFNQIKAILVKEKSDITMNELINSIQLILPKADYSQHDAQYKAFQAYVTMITDVIDSLISSSELSGLLKGDNISGEIEGIKNLLLNEAKRRYLKSRNILPELFELITDTDESLQNILENHIDTIVKMTGNISRYVVKVETKDDEKTQEQQDKLHPPEPEETPDNGEEGTGEGEEGEGDNLDTGEEVPDDGLGGGEEEGEGTGDEVPEEDTGEENPDEEVPNEGEEEPEPESDEGKEPKEGK